MPRKKSPVPTPPHVTVGGKERRGELISQSEQRTAGIEPPKTNGNGHKPDTDFDYNVGG